MKMKLGKLQRQLKEARDSGVPANAIVRIQIHADTIPYAEDLGITEVGYGYDPDKHGQESVQLLIQDNQ